MYDPIERGTYTVGVRTIQWKNRRRDNRPIDIEIWYPAQEYYHGEDIDDETCDHYEWQGRSLAQAAIRDANPYPGESPLVGFSHDLNNHRRQSTKFATHLASPGYVVAAIDHDDNIVDESPENDIRQAVENRATDFMFVLERIFAGGLGEDFSPIAMQSFAVAGHGWGGLTALNAVVASKNVEAVIGLAPAGGMASAAGYKHLENCLNLDWKQPARAMLMAADADDITPYEGVEDVCRQIPAMKSLYILSDTSHEHFLDEASPEDGFCPLEDAHLAVRALGVAHLDNVMQHKPAAHRWLTESAELSLAEHGVWLKQRF
ncbi:MAG: hypothetical protein AAF512_06265 [Pseudomonadota bacterium]